MPPPPTTDEIIERLEVLWHKLEGEGSYVSANTVGLAIDRLRDSREESARTARWKELVDFYRKAFPTEANSVQLREGCSE